ncbi:amidohydrolase family protein [Silvibacterium acidisoli]|uniref:amidohydrolase family protein n=1 Tax=Acidobacteriaceae bacterium ZG23-2 TaxID=2883246 RepID=UPI00406CAA0D
MSFSRFALLAAFSLPVSGQAVTSTVTITHVRVIDGTGHAPLADRDVSFAQGRIVSIQPASAVKSPSGKVVDGTGKTLMPALINAHGHLALVNGAKNDGDYYTEPHVMDELRQYERYGVLHMLSLGLNRDLLYGIRAEQRAGKVDGAEVFTADRGIGVPDGMPPIAHEGDQLYQPKTAGEAREYVRAAAGRHADFVKVWVDDGYGTKPKMTPEIYGAVIDEAHKHHIKVAAHVFALADAKHLVADGVDVLAHSVRDAPIDNELIAAMKAHGTYYLPTLTVDSSFFWFVDHPEVLQEPFFTHAANPDLIAMLGSDAYRQKVKNDPQTAQHRKDFAMAVRNLRIAEDAGLKVGFGTDSGAMPTRVPGWAEHNELAMMVTAGLTPLQVIHCATEVDAQLLGIAATTGTIETGKYADLLLVEGDPSKNILDTQKIASIWHRGHPVEPATK